MLGDKKCQKIVPAKICGLKVRISKEHTYRRLGLCTENSLESKLYAGIDHYVLTNRINDMHITYIQLCINT